MIIHTGEKPLDFTLCNSNFSLKTTLLNRIETHTAEKPPHCTLRNKTFTHKCNLIEHMKGHTGENPHNCTICIVKFSLRVINVFIRHIKNNLSNLN